MGLFSPSFRVVKTIWPYPSGYGVIKEQFGKPLPVCSFGLTKKQAEEDLKSIKESYNT